MFQVQRNIKYLTIHWSVKKELTDQFWGFFWTVQELRKQGPANKLSKHHQNHPNAEHATFDYWRQFWSSAHPPVVQTL